MAEEKTVYKIPSGYQLKIIEGSNKGEEIDLFCSTSYTIGRSKKCDIHINDNEASRRHARLTVERSKFELEDLESSNGTLIQGKKISKTSIQEGTVFTIGSTTFSLENPYAVSKEEEEITIVQESSDSVEKPPTPKGLKVLRLVALLVIVLAVTIIVIKKNPQPVTPNSQPDPPQSETRNPRLATRDSEPATRDSELDSPPVPEENIEKAKEYFRNGKFFYDAGHLKKAIQEWDNALTFDFKNSLAQKWLIRAEGELEKEIDGHFQKAMMHKKYLRFANAISEFRIVIELSRSKSDERYLNAVKLLKELEER